MWEGVFAVGKVVLAALGLLSFSFFNYLLCTTIAKKPWDTRIMLLHTLVATAECVIAKLANTWINTGSSAILSFLMLMLFAWWLYDARGFAWLSLTLRFILSLFCMEILCGSLMSMVSTLFSIPASELFYMSLSDLLKPQTLLWCFLLNNGSAALEILEIQAFRRLVQRLRTPKAHRHYRSAGVYVRLIAMLTIGTTVLVLATLLMNRVILSGLFNDLYVYYVILLIAICIFLLICLSYFMQDIRYLQQLSRNETLEHQQSMNASLLTSLRSFRHNTVNMLYGFEGAILSGDTKVIKSYYREMTEKCALVNNENIVALERIANPSVSALLLRAVERARQESLPINLYVAEGLRFSRALPDSDLCQVLGVLLDNAIEAALSAQVRYVSVALRNVDDALEIIVKNTYSGHITVTQLLSSQASTKPGHSGHGLGSIRELLASSPKAFVNWQVSHQYVSAQLLIHH